MSLLRILFATAIALGGIASAQAVGSGMTGSLQGTIADPSGAMIPQASVIALGDQGNREVTSSNDSGDWSFNKIPAGKYTVLASKHGFEAYRNEGVAVDSGSTVRVDVQLTVGRLAQAIDVRARRARPLPASTPGGTPRRVKVGGNLQAAKLIKSVRPVYPDAARQLDIEGAVLLEAVIGTNGGLLGLQAMNQSANPDLVAAATEAVRQWQYSPTLLNGVPVEVQTTITVNFKLE